MTQATIQALTDLCAYPQYIDRIRSEAQHCKKNDKRIWEMNQVSELRQFDSFLKESQRFNPSNYRKLPVDSPRNVPKLTEHSRVQLNCDANCYAIRQHGNP